ncbi:hypothetical protein F6Y04_00105 [Bacillus megaterium]|nr:hypothetical protein [Priestia megaterium]
MDIAVGAHYDRGQADWLPKMAETVVDLVAKQLEKRNKNVPAMSNETVADLRRRCRRLSRELPAFIAKSGRGGTLWMDERRRARLAKQYGTNVDRLFALSRQYDRSSGFNARNVRPPRLRD